MWSCRQSSWRNGCVCFWVWGFETDFHQRNKLLHDIRETMN
jgi:hypothetical protein